jgi:hypothetical protein
MTAHTTPTSHAQARGEASSIRSLDDLARLSASELAELYVRGTVPASLSALDGDLVGRMLAVRGLDRGAPFQALASFARRAGFPWGGKSFRAKDASHGTGINRLNLGRQGGRHRVFPFATHIGPSVIDDRPCVVLDYDSADNPPMIRAILDEVREVAPRIFLGPACLKRKGGGKPTVVLWFALDALNAHAN